MPESNKPPIPVNLPEGLSEDSLDDFRRKNSHIFGIRLWLEEAVQTHGAKVTGAGCGMGEADIDVEFEGQRYSIVIKQRPVRGRPQ